MLATAVLSSVLVPAALIVTAQSALAAVPDDWYCANYGAYPIKVNDDGSNGYDVETLTVGTPPSSSSPITNGIESSIDEINALGISPIDDKAYGIVSGALLVRFDNNDKHYVAEVEESATQGLSLIHI